MWTFLDFVDDQGVNVIREWLNGLGAPVKPVKARFNQRIRLLEVARTWDERYAEILHGEYDGLIAVRFKVGHVQYRPIACFGPEQREITLLVGVIERSDRYYPSTAYNTALDRRDLVMTRDRRCVCGHDFR